MDEFVRRDLAEENRALRDLVHTFYPRNRHGRRAAQRAIDRALSVRNQADSVVTRQTEENT